MVKKLILICLIGLIEIVGFASPAWGYPGLDAGLWLAQAETVPQTVPAEQPKPKTSKDTLTPSKASPPVNQQQEKTQAERSPKGQSQTQPFSPYDMDALRQFDAGDHRSK